jgi:hypothetical protein
MTAVAASLAFLAWDPGASSPGASAASHVAPGEAGHG